MRKSMGIIVFGCEQDEVNVFCILLLDFYIIFMLISDVILVDNVKLVVGN